MDIGVLKNGLGSLHNLHALLASINVGSRDLSGSVAALGEDCVSLQAAIRAVGEALLAKGISAECTQQIVSLTELAVRELAEQNARFASRGQFTVSQRLRLEPAVGRAVASLETLLPLLEDLGLACPARPEAPALTEMVHEATAWGAAFGSPRTVALQLAPEASGLDLNVDLRTARSLVTLGLSLVAAPEEPKASPGFHGLELSVKALPVVPGESARFKTVIRGNKGSRDPKEGISWRVHARSVGTLPCALEVARVAQVQFCYTREASVVELTWPTAAH